MATNVKDKVTFEIVRRCGAIDEEKNGYTLELNEVAWNSAPPKFDLRSWNEAHTRMNRGITLTHAQAVNLLKVLQESL